ALQIAGQPLEMSGDPGEDSLPASMVPANPKPVIRELHLPASIVEAHGEEGLRANERPVVCSSQKTVDLSPQTRDGKPDTGRGSQSTQPGNQRPDESKQKSERPWHRCLLNHRVDAGIRALIEHS